MNNISFEYPYLLLFIPIFLLCIKICPQKEDALLFSNTKILKESAKRYTLLDLFKILTIIFLSISISSPYILKKYEKTDHDDIDITLIVDNSLSMKDSFNKLKIELKKFIKTRNGDLFTLLFFADKVAIAAYKTKDTNFLQQSIDTIKVGSLGDMQTHLYDAIYLANNMLKDSKKKDLTILITDGKDKGSKTNLQKLLSNLKETNNTIYTIGYKDEYDKTILKNISNITNGKFYSAKNISKLIQNLKKISKKYKIKRYIQQYNIKEPLYQLPLFFGFLSLLFYTYLLNKRAVV